MKKRFPKAMQKKEKQNCSRQKTSMKTKQKYSTNELAQKIVGKRPPINGIIFDQPCELDYHCPVCEYDNVVAGNFDERLRWSEYNGFLWCSKCNIDFPSALCQPDKKKAVKTYLDCVHDAKQLGHNKRIYEEYDFIIASFQHPTSYIGKSKAELEQLAMTIAWLEKRREEFKEK